MSKRRWTDEQFIEAVKNNFSIAAVIKAIGLKVTGANYSTVKQSVKRLSLDTSHWTGQGHLKGKTHNWNPKQDLAQILVADSTYTNMTCLKKRLLQESLLDYRCALCGIVQWNEKPISLQIDHINGNHFDHRLENLRLLCPNCHSQTETFAGKNK